MPDPGAVAAWALGAALVLYLGLQAGGYDAVVRGEVGVVVWWTALCAVCCGALPLPLRNRAAIALVALLGGFLIWTALALSWTDSSERTVTEIARVATYLGFLVLGLAVSADGKHARSLLNGVTTAVGLLLALGVLSRLHPAWFPTNEIGTVLPGIEIERRLAYPLNYSSAVGTLAAIAFPLLLGATASARTIAGSALAAAALALAGFAFVLASSGTGTGVAIVVLVAFFVLVPDRPPKLGSALIAAAGTGVLAAGLNARPALDRGLPTPAAIDQGNELLLIGVVAIAGVMLAQAALALAVRRGSRPRALSLSRAQAGIATAAVVIVAIPAALAAGAPGKLSDGWERFKDPVGTADQGSRTATLLDASSSGRYQIWRGAIDAGDLDPWQGLGPGTFEYYWAGSDDNFGPIKDPHSLYLQAYAELGIPGITLIVAFVLVTLGIGVWRSLRAGPAARLRIATATAAACGFAAGAALDWIWLIAALPAVFMLLAAVIATDRDDDPLGGRSRRRRRTPTRTVVATRLGFAVLAIAMLVAIVLPLRGASALRASQADVARGDLDAALAKADDAADAQPYAAAPVLQRALILELQGDFDDAAAAAREATANEPTNWRNWAILARMEARAGNDARAIAAYKHARDLHPKIYGSTG